MYYLYLGQNALSNPLDKELSVFSPKLTVEVGKAGALIFSVPPNNRRYDDLAHLKTEVLVFSDDTLLFRGRILSIGRNMYNEKTVYCEGDLSYLVDSVQKDAAYTGTVHGLFRQAIANHNRMVDKNRQFTPGRITVLDAPLKIVGISDDVEDEEGNKNYRQIAINSATNNWKNTLDYMQSALIDNCGGYLNTRFQNGTRYLDYIAEYTDDSAQEILFGANLLDLSDDISAEEMFTALIPLGENNLTIESVNGGEPDIVNDKAVSQYGKITRTQVFDGVTDPNELKELGKSYLAKRSQISVSIHVRAVDLNMIDSNIPPLKLGDNVRIESAPHGISDHLTISKIEYDLENPENTEYTFGLAEQTLTERRRRDKKKLQEEVKRSGRGGGGAAKEADEQAAKKRQELYDAYIGFDKETATVTLWAMYEKYNEANRVLLSKCGIDLSGKTANVNIHTLREYADDLGKRVASQAARIDLLHTDTEAKISLVTARHNELKGVTETKMAKIDIWANETESRISAKAEAFAVEALKIDLEAAKKRVDGMTIYLKECGIDVDSEEGKVNVRSLYSVTDGLVDSVRKNETKITTMANEFKASAKMTAEMISNGNKKTAEIEAKVESLRSAITLKADAITLDSKVLNINADIISIQNEIYKLKKLVAEEVTANRIKAFFTKSTVLDVGVVRANEITISGEKAVTGSIVEAMLNRFPKPADVASKQWVNEQKFLKSVPSTGYFSSLYVNGYSVATQSWVESLIDNKLSDYAKKSHSHNFSQIYGVPSYRHLAYHSHPMKTGASSTGYTGFRG